MNVKKPAERGQALILIAAGILAMVLIVGLGVDVGNAFSDRRRAQNAADTAAMTAALAFVTGDPQWIAAGQSIAAANGYSSGVEIIRPPTSGYYAGNTDYIEVQIVSTVPTTFSRVFNITEITNRVRAVAHAKPPLPKPLYDGNAVVGLAPHECSAVKYQGNANTTLVGSGLFVNSDCETAAFFNNSSAATLTAPYLNSVGGVTYKPGAINAPITTGNNQYSYPPTYAMPHPSCLANSTQYGNVLTPGFWDPSKGSFPPKNVTQLESGVYCIFGDFVMNAGDVLVGQDVVIFMINGDVIWNGGAELHLDAPNTGPFKGLLLYAPISNQATIQINGNANSTFSGTFLAPASDIIVKGTGSATGIDSQIIGYTVDLSGDSATRIVYNESSNWITTEPPTVELAD